jgi:polysaccharide export outer membrane protein
VNDVQAAGKTPVDLASEIEASLKAVLNVPRVTVIVVESSPLPISVFGEVGKAGVQTLTRNAGVAEALAAAGGLTPFAHKDRIYVVRPGEPRRIQFSYDNLIGGTGRGPMFRLRPGDVIVVE